MKTLLLLRHGQSRANLLNLVNGILEDPLTPLGEAQAAAAGEAIGKSGLTIDRAFTSHWRRARQTALLALPGVEFACDKRLGETDPGIAAALTFQELPERHPEFLLPFDPDRPYPGGESHQRLYDRSIEWLREAVESAPGDETILAVSHGGPICCILQYACKVPMRDFPMFVPANAAFSKLILDDAGHWTLKYFSVPPSCIL